MEIAQDEKKMQDEEDAMSEDLEEQQNKGESEDNEFEDLLEGPAITYKNADVLRDLIITPL